jgi:hypothetical protein
MCPSAGADRLFFRGTDVEKGSRKEGRIDPWGEDTGVERTRERVGIHGLDDTERRELLKRFVAHGGKVLGEEEKRSKGEILRRSKGAGISGWFGAGRRGGHEASSAASAAYTARGGADFSAGPFSNVTKSFLPDRILVQLKGFKRGIFTFGGRRLDDGFVRSIKTEMRERLKETHLAMCSILNGEVNLNNELLRMSTGKNSTFYEVLLRLNGLYDEEELGGIIRAISSRGGKPYRGIPPPSTLPLFKGFFRKLYVLSQYRPLCGMCAIKAIEIQGRYAGMSGEAVRALKTRVARNVDYLLDEICVKIHLLLCKIAKGYYPCFSPELDDFLGITEDDLLGSITRMMKRRRMEGTRVAVKPKPPWEDEKGPAVPPQAEGGLPVVRRAIERYEESRRNGADDPIRLLGRGDSLYAGFLLLEIFDKEYSFILTTGKISFNIDYKDQKKINVKGDLGYAYLLLSEFWEEAKNYLDVVREAREISADLRLTPYRKFVSEKALERKRSLAGRSVKKKVLEVLKAIEGILEIVIADYNANGRLLQNPDEVLEFDRNIDGEKSVSGKRVIEAITEAYLFCAAAPFFVQCGELGGLDDAGSPADGAPEPAVGGA